jgi:hypothetical protein
MTAPLDDAASSARPMPLEILSRRLRHARETVHRHRQGPAGSTELAEARHDLVMALEDYTSALEARGLPVPPSLHTELRLHRRLFGW